MTRRTMLLSDTGEHDLCLCDMHEYTVIHVYKIIMQCQTSSNVHMQCPTSYIMQYQMSSNVHNVTIILVSMALPHCLTFDLPNGSEVMQWYLILVMQV